jgi:hypothetical protein
MDQPKTAPQATGTSTPGSAPADDPGAAHARAYPKAVTPLHSNGCALLIGINDYRAFDPSGNCDLKGGAHDTVAIARCCTVLGMDPVDIHILRDDIESSGNPFTIEPKGKTTRAAIQAQLEWLREQLDAGRKGLLWYSGHGAYTEKDGLLLCPSDTDTAFANTISFNGLKTLLGPNAAKNLTVVLDCCHGGPRVDKLGRRSSTLGGDPIEAGAAFDLQIGAIVLAACAPGEQTQQSWFSALAHGAFTWALLSTANQWQAQQQGGNVRMDLDYATLMAKASELLHVLEFEGKPQLYGPPGVDVGKLAALQLGDAPEATSQYPDADRGGVELDPDMRYTLSLGGGLTSTIATSPVSSRLTPLTNCLSTEYWTVNAAFLTAARNGTGSPMTMRATSPSSSWPLPAPGASSNFGMPTNAVWTKATMPTARVWQGTLSDGSIVALDFSGLAAPKAGGIWSGSLTWYLVPGTQGLQALIFGAAGDTLTLQYAAASAPASSQWYTMEQSPLTWSPTRSVVTPPRATSALQTTSVAARDNKLLYMSCNCGSGSTSGIFTSSNGSSWTNLNVNQGSFGYLAALDTSVYVACVNEGAISIYDLLSDPRIEAQPYLYAVPWGLVGLNHLLYLVYTGNSDDLPHLSVWSVGKSIEQVGTSTTIMPTQVASMTLAAFNDRLYVACKTAPTSGPSALQVWWYDPSATAAWQLTTGDLSPLPATATCPTLAVFNNRLFLVVVDSSTSHVWLCSTPSDGAAAWSGFQDLTLQMPTLLVNPNVAPVAILGLAALGNSLVLAYGDGTNVYTVQTLAT